MASPAVGEQPASAGPGLWLGQLQVYSAEGREGRGASRSTRKSLGCRGSPMLRDPSWVLSRICLPGTPGCFPPSEQRGPDPKAAPALSHGGDRPGCTPNSVKTEGSGPERGGRANGGRRLCGSFSQEGRELAHSRRAPRAARAAPMPLNKAPGATGATCRRSSPSQETDEAKSDRCFND